MVFSPDIQKQLSIGLDHLRRTPDISVGQATLRDDAERHEVDPRFAIPVDMNMRRLMIRRVDHETQAVLAKDRYHR
jgi:hypothetical protein